MSGELIRKIQQLFLFFMDSVYNRDMKNETILMFLCFSVVLTAGLAGCARADGVASPGKVEVNYPDVWERVLPEEMRTNIANYSAGDLYDVEKEHTDLLDYAVSVEWKIGEIYHVDDEYHDDVIFRFTSREDDTVPNFYTTVVVYYSFFSGQLLSKDGSHRFLDTSTIYDVIPASSTAHRLSISTRLTLSDGVIYDENIRNYQYRDRPPVPYSGITTCHEPPGWGMNREGVALKYYWTSHEGGVQFLPVGYAEEEIAREDSWILLQGLDEPRLVIKHCLLLNAALAPTRIYSYYQYSFLRILDEVVPLPDGTFLFVGIKNPFPVFHIIRMQPDMSIPVELDNRYKWVRYKDYAAILDLYERDELFSERNITCPLLDAAHPHCVKAEKDGYCSVVEGWYLEYYRSGYLNSYISRTVGLPQDRALDMHSCLNLALRDYVRGEFEIYHCGGEYETVASLTPCDQKAENNNIGS